MNAAPTQDQNLGQKCGLSHGWRYPSKVQQVTNILVMKIFQHLFEIVFSSLRTSGVDIENDDFAPNLQPFMVENNNNYFWENSVINEGDAEEYADPTNEPEDQRSLRYIRWVVKRVAYSLPFRYI